MEKIDQRQRLLLVIALSFGFITLLQVVFGKPAEPVGAGSADGGVAVLAAADVDGGGGPVAAVIPTEPLTVADGGTQAVAQAEPSKKELPLREVERARKMMNLRFSSEGGSLVSAQLTGPREREQQHVSIAQGYQKLFGKKLDPPRQMDMAVPTPGTPNPLAVAVKGGTHPLPATARYELLEESAQAVVFRATTPSWQVDKRFSWDEQGFALAMQVTVKNLTAQPATAELAVVYPRQIDPKSEEKSSLFGGIGNEAKVHCLVGDDLQTHGPSDDPVEAAKGPVKMAAIDQQYFLAAVYPEEPKDGTCEVIASHVARVTTVSMPLTVGPGESQTVKYGVFLGPKDFELLKATGHGLERTVDFGWWAVICKVLLTVLQFFHRLVGNWGLAIILLTVSVKVLLLPLTHKAMVSAEAMKKLQPKMEEIKKKYPDDRERQNVEVMKLYQEAKVNPLGGCLPLLLQLPIWAALFTTLRTSYDLYGEPFFGPVWTDLTFKDPTYLLPLALGITMIITQRLQPQMMDKQQAFIFTWIMPVFFTALMMNYPAGLSLYIFTNNLLSILQQFLLRKYLQNKGIAAPPTSKGPPPGGGRLKESAS